MASAEQKMSRMQLTAIVIGGRDVGQWRLHDGATGQKVIVIGGRGVVLSPRRNPIYGIKGAAIEKIRIAAAAKKVKVDYMSKLVAKEPTYFEYTRETKPFYGKDKPIIFDKMASPEPFKTKPATRKPFSKPQRRGSSYGEVEQFNHGQALMQMDTMQEQPMMGIAKKMYMPPKMTRAVTAPVQTPFKQQSKELEALSSGLLPLMKTQYRSEQRQEQETKLNYKTQFSQVQKQRFNVNTKFDTKYNTAATTRFNIGTKVASSTATRQAQRFRVQTMTVTTTMPYPTPTPTPRPRPRLARPRLPVRPIEPTTPKIPMITMPSFEMKASKPKYYKGAKRTFKYTPSTIAVIKGITTRKPVKSKFTGLEFRPIFKGGKL